jgi:hypothetical protein
MVEQVISVETVDSRFLAAFFQLLAGAIGVGKRPPDVPSIKVCTAAADSLESFLAG